MRNIDMVHETAIRRRAQGEQQEDTAINGRPIDQKTTKDAVGVKENRTLQVSNTAVATTIFSPVLLTTLALIFGGCCSNVYTLESILKMSPATGTLVTFLQFLLTSFFSLRSQIIVQSVNDGDKNSRKWFSLIPRFRKRTIPITKWLMYTAFFLTINILNNAAFNYKISVPLHIILRSAGPVTSMLVGYVVAGRRYTPRQITAVILLFAGVVLAALSDAQSKSRSRRKIMPEDSDDITLSNITESITTTKLSTQAPGFVLLFSALLLSAVMGIYTDNLYSQYGRSTAVTNENIFYSHTLSLPFFAVQTRTLQTQFTAMVGKMPFAASQSSTASVFSPSIFRSLFGNLPQIPFLTPYLLKPNPSNSTAQDLQIYAKPLLLLLANALTQIVCILGVNRLSTQTTSLTVSIVLNIRKLISLLLSIWLFGNRLPSGVILGATLVFLGGGLYGFKGKEKKPTLKSDEIDMKQQQEDDDGNTTHWQNGGDHHQAKKQQTSSTSETKKEL